MDTTLVAGLLTIAGTLCSGVLGLAGVLVKRHLAFLSKLEANDDEKTKSMAIMASEMTRTRELQQAQGAAIAGLRTDLEDKRNSETVTQSKVATALLERTLATIQEGTITGKHAAVTAERAEIMGEEPAEEPRPARATSGMRTSRPR